MNRTTRHTLLTYFAHLSVVAFFMLALAGCAQDKPEAKGKVRVVSGILPYADIIAQIGGDFVDVTTLIPPGKDPHTFDLDPRRMMDVNKADIVLFNGAGLEMWSDRIAEGFGGNVRVIWADRVLHSSLIQADEEEHDGHYHEGGINPHFWLDPVLMKDIAATVRDALIEADPKRKTEYTRNTDVFLARLDSLDEGIRAGVQQWRTRSFVTTHPAWAYFCHRYGLTEAAVLEEGPGKEISARQMAGIAKRMESEGLTVIFTQYMFPDAVANALSRETGAHLAELDPHGSKNTSVHYIELMKYNVDTMNAAMQ